jgi:hypothetical protein
VSILSADSAAETGNQGMIRAIAMPTSEATMPMPIILATGCRSPAIRGSSSGGPPVLPAAGSLSLIGARVY